MLKSSSDLLLALIFWKCYCITRAENTNLLKVSCVTAEEEKSMLRQNSAGQE